MTTQMKPLNEVNYLAIRLLSEEIGIVDTIRFVNQFTTGHGNYTDERDTLFGHLTLDDVITAIENKRDKSADKSLNPTPANPAP